MTRRSAKRNPKIEERIFKATLAHFADRGLRAATTHSIAEAAGVNESTLFRYFGTKANLITEMIVRYFGELDKVVPAPSGKLTADLQTLASRYWRFFVKHPNLLAAFFAELSRESNRRLRTAFLAEQEKTIGKLRELFAYYRDRGALAAEFDDLSEEAMEDWIATNFLGAIFARVSWYGMGVADGNFDSKRYVRNFLEGYERRPPAVVAGLVGLQLVAGAVARRPCLPWPEPYTPPILIRQRAAA